MKAGKAFTRSTCGAMALVAGLALLAVPPRAVAQNATSPVVQVRASGSVSQVLGRLKRMVASNGMMVMGELHQGKVIAMTGLHVNSETIFVGNPQVGKQLFAADPGVGLVVPVRINVFQDAQGGTVVSYVPPSTILGAFHNPTVDHVAQMLDGKLHNLVGMLGGQ